MSDLGRSARSAPFHVRNPFLFGEEYKRRLAEWPASTGLGKSDSAIFRVTLDEAVRFRERGSALESDMARETGKAHEPPQGPADPEILFDDRDPQVASGRCLFDEGVPVFGRASREFIHFARC